MYGRKYLADRKYNVPQCTSIGKLSDNDPSMMIPNSNYLKFFPDAELPVELPESIRSGCLRIGSYLAIKKVIRHYGLDEKLEGIIGKDYGLFLDLAAMQSLQKTTLGSIIRSMPSGIRYHDLPEDADSSFFLCKELIPGYLDDVTGVYHTPRGYYVKDEDVDEIDKEFPTKVKLKLPGQI